MIAIAKRFKTYVLPRNLHLSSSEVHCSSKKLAFPHITIMSLGRRSLSCFKEQLKLFALRNNHVPRNLNCSNEQPCHLKNKCVQKFV